MDRIQAIDQRMAVLQAKAQGQAAASLAPDQLLDGISPSPSPSPQRVDFGALLQQIMETMNAEQQHADGLKEAYEAGRIDDLAAVMLENQKAITAFQGLSAVRNRLVEAYQEINRMPL